MQKKSGSLLLVLIAVVAQFACGGAGSSPPPPPGTFQVSNVFVVVLENHSFSSVIGNTTAMPYLNSLAASNALATNYFANTHPSIGNYFMLTTGQIISNDDSFPGTVAADNIVRELTSAGKSWRGYFDSLPSVGYTGGDILPYVKHHNPFAYFTDVLQSPAQQANIVPASQLAQDTASGQLPQFGLIVPNDFENGHGCPLGIGCNDDVVLGAADTWLRLNVDPLIKSPAFQRGGLLFILFDESLSGDTANGGGQVPVVVVSAGVKPGFRSSTLYQHQNLLRTVLQELGSTTFPGAAANAAPMSDFFK